MVHAVVGVIVRVPESSAEMAPCGCFGIIFELQHVRGSRGAIVQRTCSLGSRLLKVGHPLKHKDNTATANSFYKPQALAVIWQFTG